MASVEMSDRSGWACRSFCAKKDLPLPGKPIKKIKWGAAALFEPAAETAKDADGKLIGKLMAMLLNHHAVWDGGIFQRHHNAAADMEP